jgi:hypothetical protein
MRNRKHGLKALGLSFLAALGLLALTAAGAAATAWDVNGTLMSEALLPEMDGALKESALIVTKNGIGQALIIHCSEFTVTAGNLHLKDGTATIQYDNTTCLTLINGMNQKNCGHEVVGGINMLPFQARILPVLHNGVVYLLAEPQSGTAFTQVHYGGLCSLPLVSIGGTVTFECEDGKLVPRSCEVPAVKQLVRPVTNQALFGDELKYGANLATLQGEAEVFLKGAHANLPFNAL